ncbi:MAG: hypothetical protein Q4G04_06935 [bacterium]|nr:hypothetical protein [bacterium]
MNSTVLSKGDAIEVEMNMDKRKLLAVANLIGASLVNENKNNDKNG